MSAEQRASAAPPAAADASARLAGAFEQYGAGLTQAAAGLRATDGAATARAVALIEEARTEVAEATKLLDSALTECGVAPEAESGSTDLGLAGTMWSMASDGVE